MRTLGVSAPARARPLHAHNEPRELPGLHRLGRYFYASLRVRSWQADRFCLRGRTVDMGHHGRTGEAIISEAPRYQPPPRVVGQIACSDAGGFNRRHLLCALQDHREGYGRGLR
jgi:hypothetical protein